MQKLRKHIYSICLVAALLIFIACKIPALPHAYFWDELGVYARGALFMHDNTIGLLPKDLPPELSRGHPLLFFFIYAIGFTFFGDGVTGGHVLSLLFAILLLLSVYRIVKRNYSEQTALIAVLVLMVQPLFYAQSVLVLPEILLLFFMLEALSAWTEKKFFLYALFSAGAMLTKETAIIIPVVILCAEIGMLSFSKKYRFGFTMQFRQLLLFFPYIVYAAFLLLQHHQNGWYLFPLHGNNVKFSWERFDSFTHDFSQFLFLEQGRIILSVITILILLLLSVKRKWKLHYFSVVLIFLVAGGIFFNAMNFYMNRYMLFCLSALVILFAALLTECFRIWRWTYLLLPAVLVTGIWCMHGKLLLFHPKVTGNIALDFPYDENMQYVSYLQLQQQAVEILEEKVQPGDTVYANFPVGFALTDTRLGSTHLLLHKEFELQPGRGYQTGFNYAIIIAPGSYDNMLPPDDSLHILGAFENAIARVRIVEPAKN